MKKVSEIMDDLGFRPEGSDAVKKAFIKNLIKQAQESTPRNHDEPQPSRQAVTTKSEDVQLSLFDFKKSS